MPRVSVLLVDDHTLFRDSLRHLFANTGGIEVVADSATGERALELLNKVQPDVVLMDYDLASAQMDGIETMKQIHAQRPNLPVVMLSMYGERQIIVAAAQAGAAGYVLKNVPSEELIQAVRLAAAGRAWLSPEAAQGLLASVAAGELEGDSHVAARYGITEQERLILECVANGMTYEQVSKEVFLSVSRVKALMGGVCEKLGAHGQTQAAVIAVAEGIITPPNSSTEP